MKTSYSLNSLVFILLMGFNISARSESKLTGETQNRTQLPSEVTNDWLSDARDENGNKIFLYIESFPLNQSPNETDDIPYNLAMTGEAANDFQIGLLRVV